MGTTTPGKLPWPEGTDLVRDGDNAIRSLAEAADKADTVALATATLASSGISTGRTGWNITPNQPDPSGRVTIQATGMTAVRAGAYFVQFQPTLTSPGSVTFGIVVADPNTGAIYAQTTYSAGGAGTKIAGMWVFGAGQTVYPVFLQSTAGSVCNGGWFEIFHFGARAAA